MNSRILRQLFDRICDLIPTKITYFDIRGRRIDGCDDDSYDSLERIVSSPLMRKEFFDTYHDILKTNRIDIGNTLKDFEEKYQLGGVADLTTTERADFERLKLLGWEEEESVTPCPGTDRNKEYKKFPNSTTVKMCLSKNKFKDKYPKTVDTDPFYCIHNFKYYSETANLKKSVMSTAECERIYDEETGKNWILCYYKNGGVKLFHFGTDTVAATGIWNCLGNKEYYIKWDKNGQVTKFELNTDVPQTR